MLQSQAIKTPFGWFLSAVSELNCSSNTLALRSGSTIVNEVYPRHGYCLLKTTPNTPRVGPEIWADIAIFYCSYGSKFKIRLSIFCLRKPFTITTNSDHSFIENDLLNLITEWVNYQWKIKPEKVMNMFNISIRHGQSQA